MGNEHSPITGGRLVLLTVGVSLGLFMEILDTAIANVAIPSIAGDLAVSPDQGTWVITAFMVSLAITLPVTGWLGKRRSEERRVGEEGRTRRGRSRWRARSTRDGVH